ncbi:MAG: pilus assembly protein [Gemmataceae bacterium]|nr:pilus assembly protein [Gemmataceae bacterium]MCI0639930.1 pilus assembly protein [Gemmataceae bacterium]MCI0741179.1 pilus assembly protein [Gemmataceae bacterium]
MFRPHGQEVAISAPRQRRKLAHVRRGVAAVELAILLPFLVFIFLVAVDFCRVFYASQIVENSARNGALFAAKVYNYSTWRGSIDSIEKAVRADASNLDQSKLTVKSSTSSTDVAVTVSYQFATIASFPVIPSKYTITRTVHMKLAP